MESITESGSVENGLSSVNRSVRTIPTVAITEEEFDIESGDMDDDTSNSTVPFSHYKGSLENVYDASNDSDTNKDPANGDANVKAHIHANHSVLKVGPKFDTLSDTSQPGSRKVSFHSDVGSHPNSRKVSSYEEGRHDGMLMQQMQYLHPAYGGIPMAQNFRKHSSQPFSMFSAPSSRKTSMEAFYCPQPTMPKYSQHGKVSVFSIGNGSDTGYIDGDEEECLPDLGHYRISVFDNQRPTLFELRQDDEV